MPKLKPCPSRQSARRNALVPLALGFVLLASSALAQTPPPPPPPVPGWTQIDVTWPGHQLSSGYTGNPGTATFDIWVKDATGKYVKKTLTVDIKKGMSTYDVACAIAMKLDACIQMNKFQFSYSKVDNGITVWPTDSGADPDKEGMPGRYPPDVPRKPMVDMKVVKETHPNKK